MAHYDGKKNKTKDDTVEILFTGSLTKSELSEWLLNSHCKKFMAI